MRPTLRRSLGVCLILGTLSFFSLSRGWAQGDTTPVLVWDEALYGGEQELRWPVAVASRAENELAVADAHQPRVTLFEYAQGVWSKTRTVELGGFPAGMTATKDRYILSLRNPAGMVALAAPNWALRALPVPSGTIPGAMTTAPDGTVLIVDRAGETVMKLSPAGSITGAIPVSGDIAALAGLPSGGFLAAHPQLGRVIRYRADGQIDEEFAVPGLSPVPAWPVGLAALENGQFFVLDRHGGRVLLLDPEGRVAGVGSRLGWDEGLIRFPSGLAIIPGGRVAVADQGNGRVQIFHRE